MKKVLLILVLFINTIMAKDISPSEVYTQAILIQDEIHYLLKHYNIKHNHQSILARSIVQVSVEPRNVWQKTYEIMIKLNILRGAYSLPIVAPVNIPPVTQLNPNLVYEQTQRILTELRIFETRMDIKHLKHKPKIFKNKTPLDVFNILGGISLAIDALNKNKVTPSYVFGENMRVYDDITLILSRLNISDKTIPAKKNSNSTPNDTANTAIKILNKIKQLQLLSGIKFVDFSNLKRKIQTHSDVLSLIQMIISELQTIKVHLHIQNITPSAAQYALKTPAEVDQLMSWNLRKISLIRNLNGENR